MDNTISWRALTQDPDAVKDRLDAGETLIVLRNDEVFAVLSAYTRAANASAPSSPHRLDFEPRQLDTDTRPSWKHVADKVAAVHKAALQASSEHPQGIFSTTDVMEILQEDYADVNIGTVRVYLIRDTIDHTSRHHYAGGTDRWQTAPGGRFQPIARPRR